MGDFDLASVLRGEYLDWLVDGLILSIQLTVVTWLLAVPLATATALCRLSSTAALRGVGFVMVEGIRNIPLLAHMLFWYFAVPELLPEALRAYLYEHNAEAVCAVAALTLYTSAYMAEDIRSGIRSIPVTQLEAARALGFGFLPSMRRIVLPQAVRIIVPPLLSQTLNLWKNTSIATVIGTSQLMYQAQRVETASFRGVETFTVTTLAYLTVSLFITLFAVLYQRRFPVRAQ
jgi:polar amino acid transport system permease protein